MTALGALAPDSLVLSASVRSDVQMEHRDLGRDPSRSVLLARLELNCVPHAIVMVRYLVRMAASPLSVSEGAWACVGKVTGLVNQWGRYTCWPMTESVGLRPEAEIQPPHAETGCCRRRTARDVAKQKATPTVEGLGAGRHCDAMLHVARVNVEKCRRRRRQDSSKTAASRNLIITAHARGCKSASLSV